MVIILYDIFTKSYIIALFETHALRVHQIVEFLRQELLVPDTVQNYFPLISWNNFHNLMFSKNVFHS